MDRFTRDDILVLLGELGDRLLAKGVHGEVFILGGSAIAIAYSDRRVTADIDAIFVPVEEVEAEVLAMAQERRLPKDWLNNAVQETLHGVAEDDAPRDVLTTDGIEVKVASPEYILALKAMISSRELVRDIEDAAMLCNLLGITSEDRIEAIVRRYFSESARLGAQELRFERIIDKAATARTGLPVNGAKTIRPLVGGCGHWMKISRRSCSLPAGHHGQHR